MDFVFAAIKEHTDSKEYRAAQDAKMYAEGKNATISRYQKLLYTLTGQAVPDNYTANHKCKSGFFKRFVTQEASFEVGNGVTFEKEDTKDKFGKRFDNKLYKAVKDALIQGVSYGFYNLDHVEFYQMTEFVPFFDEEDGAIKAGVRFWRIDNNKPLRARLFELNGYTDYFQDKDGDKHILHEKRPYVSVSKKSEADGERIYGGENYPGFPVIPLYGNTAKQSELVGIREAIDCYDLIKSGFANDLDDASMLYWTITNAGGMDDVDMAKFIERMKTVRVTALDDEQRAESHTVDVPYQSREVYLTRLENDLYKDFMALNTEVITAGAVTATQIKSAYEPLNEKCDELEMCLLDFMDALFEVAGIADENATFKRSMISNEVEYTEMILSAATVLDTETILKKLPFLTAEEVEGVLERKAAEEADRYKQMAAMQQSEPLEE